MLIFVVSKRVDWTLVSLNSNLAFSSFQVPEKDHAVRGTTKQQVTKHLRQNYTDHLNKKAGLSNSHKQSKKNIKITAKI